MKVLTSQIKKIEESRRTFAAFKETFSAKRNYPYISKDKNKNKDKYNSRSEMRQPERNTSARKRIDFQIEKHRIEERKKQQKIEQ